MDMKTEFDQKGYIFPIDVFGEDEICTYRATFDALEQEFGKEHTQKGVIGMVREYEFI